MQEHSSVTHQESADKLVEVRAVPSDVSAAVDLRRWVTEEALSGRPDVALDDNTELLKTGYLDSLLMLRLVAFMESRFGVEVPDEEVLPAHFRNVGAMAALVHKLQQEKAGQGS
jgi:acyl carrier protein